jgi:predicted MFS family arabinose efflux permease
MRSKAASVYLLLFTSEVTLVALIPLAPRFAESFDLTGVETGALLATAGFATIFVSLPVGLLADRFGPHRLTVAMGALLTLSCVAQGIAPDYPSLLGARIAFGASLGGLWTAGLALLSTSLSGRRRTTALGGTITVAAAANVGGPILAGLVGDAFELGTPFLILAAVATLATVTLALDRGDSSWVRERRSLRVAVAVARRERYVLAAVLLMIVIGIVNGSVNLLVPLELRGDGMSAGEIGVWFSLASVVFLIGTVVVTRLAGRGAGLRLAGLATICYAILLLLPIATGTTAVLLAFLLVRAPFWASLSTVVFPLGAIGAERAAAGQGTVVGGLNLTWGFSNTVGPLLAGAVADSVGLRAAYLPAFVVCLLVGTTVLALARRARADVLEPVPEPG